MSVTTELVTVEEFLKLPDPKEGHLELHHGEVVLMPPPKWVHQKLQATILRLLLPLLGSRGVVLTEMAFRPAAQHEVWSADVGFVSAARAAKVGKDDYLSGAPDLVVEVLSPSNTVDEMNDRMSICLSNGCLSFWLVDPKQQRVSVTEGDVTRHYGRGTSVSCLVVPGAISVEEIFG